LSINSIFGTIQNFGAAGAQLLRQCVNPYHAEVNVRGAFGRVRTNRGVIGAVEKHLNLITPDYGENVGRIWLTRSSSQYPAIWKPSTSR
jgi:hypothetical protein